MNFMLPKDYDREAPPIGPTGPLDVSIQLQVDRILDIDMENNLLSIDLWAFMDWRDNRLLINESDGVTSSIQLSAKKGEHLWKPNFVTWFMKSLARREALEDLIRYTVRSDQTILYVTGITLRVPCQFDTDLYPFDLQNCPVKMIPYPESAQQVKFRWANTPNSLYFGMNKGDEIRTPKFVMKLKKVDKRRIEGSTAISFSVLEFCLQLRRQIIRHILAIYVPSGIFVIMSWGSFFIDPELVPGRMVLLVTNLLTLITMFEATRSEVPPSLNVQAIDIWLLSCIMFVFNALIEYACLLFKLRSRRATSRQTLSGSIKRNTLYATTVYRLKTTKTKAKVVQNCEFCWINIKNRIHEFVSCKGINFFSEESKWNILDKLSLIIFPALFLLCNIAYWSYFITKLFEENPETCS